MLLIAMAGAQAADDDATLTTDGTVGIIGCDQCGPCRTPPCYKDDGVFDYSSNQPGGSYHSPAVCWKQRSQWPEKAYSPAKQPREGHVCSCPQDWVEYETTMSGIDSNAVRVERSITARS